MAKAIKFTDKIIGDIETKLAFSTNPVYEDSDINVIVYSLMARDEPLEWIKYRKPLFMNPNIVTDLQELVNAL